jgi:P27 family predicted phage terminase small subunit
MNLKGAGGRPKPTHLKIIEGNPGKRRLNQREPQPTRGEMPDPPDFLNEHGKLEWVRLAPELYRLGLLTSVDLNPLAAYCQAFGRWLQAERALAEMKDRPANGLVIKTTSGNAIQNPLVGTANKAARDMMRYASEFGLTPAARARLDGIGMSGDALPQSKFEGLFNQ